MNNTQHNVITSSHNLNFEVAPYENNIDPQTNWMRFRVGTVQGLYTFTDTTLDILAIDNAEPGNGHLNDVFEWFEYSCKKYKMDFRILEVMNKRFLKHLIEKRGFKKYSKDNVIKKFR